VPESKLVATKSDAGFFHAKDYFHIPADLVVEIGAQVNL
jgi:hypothetical protein